MFLQNKTTLSVALDGLEFLAQAQPNAPAIAALQAVIASQQDAPLPELVHTYCALAGPLLVRGHAFPVTSLLADHLNKRNRSAIDTLVQLSSRSGALAFDGRDCHTIWKMC